MYPDLQTCIHDSIYFIERGILAPLNDNVNMLNTKIFAQYPEREKIYFSADTLDKIPKHIILFKKAYTLQNF